MNNNYYPELDAGHLLPIKIALGSMLNDALWLDRAGCPYDPELCSALKELFIAFRTKQVIETRETATIDGAVDKWANLEAELNTLFSELRNYSGSIEEGDAKEKMAYFRASTSLLEKIVGLSERAHNVKSVSDFQSKVISIFDEILTPEQRTLAMEKLSP